LRQRQPLEAHLPAVMPLPFADGGEIIAATMEDRLDLMEVAVNPVHGVVLADVFAEVEQTLRYDREAELFEDFASDGITQRLAVVLAASRQDEEVSFFRPDANREQVAAPQDHGARRRPDAGGDTAGLASRRGHAVTLPGTAGQ